MLPHQWTKVCSQQTMPGDRNSILCLGMCILEHLEVLEHSGIFISNPEYRILFRNNLLGEKWADRAEVSTPISDHVTCEPARYVTMQCSELECFFFSVAQECHWKKLIGIICFADFAVFHVHLIQIYFESKYSEKLWLLDSNTEGSIICIHNYVHIVLALRLPGVTAGFCLRIFAFDVQCLTVSGVSQPSSIVTKEIWISQGPQHY